MPRTARCTASFRRAFDAGQGTREPMREKDVAHAMF